MCLTCAEGPRGKLVQHRSRFARRLCIAVDAEGYGSRDSVAQYDLQALLPDILNAAADAAGLDRSAWAKQPQGDGELALVPPDQPEPRVVDDFVRELAAELQLRNHGLIPTTRLRLRAALDFGVAYEAPSGFAGEAVVATARLLGSSALHNALAKEAHADLAVALSAEVFATVVGRHTSLAPDEFTCVKVKEKEYTSNAWIRVLPSVVPNDDRPHNTHQKPFPERPQSDHKSNGRSTAKPSYGVQNHFYESVDADVIGINIASASEDRP